jgi:hypothetical protein
MAAVAAPACPVVGLLALSDELLLGCCRHLGAADLARLELVAARFATHAFADPTFVRPHRLVRELGGGAGLVAATWSLAQEAARRHVCSRPALERGRVGSSPLARPPTWLRTMRELEALRRPLRFDRAHPNLLLADGGARASNTALVTPILGDTTHRAAVSDTVMRRGLHYAEFALSHNEHMCFNMIGAMRPDWDVLSNIPVFGSAGSCFYNSANGARCPGNSDWLGRQRARGGDRIGLLLDLDRGSMTAFKNSRMIGVLQESGLRGPLCWAAAVVAGTVQICSRPVPDSSGPRDARTDHDNCVVC